MSPAVGEGARLADVGDLPTLVELASSFAATLQDRRGGSLLLADEALSGPVKERFATALAVADQFLVVGTYDQVVFGYALLGMKRLRDDTLVGELRHFIVAEDARKVGIGEAIMNLSQEIFREHGCTGIESSALPGDRHTKNFFESFGLKARLLTVHRTLL